MRTSRIYESDFEIDELEKNWWNNNATIIEKIWAQNIHFQKIIRLPYLKRMKIFFLNNNMKKPFRILEVGCGTGWVCRLVADEEINIIGTDFSEGQLNIANAMSKMFNKDKYCVYKLADASSFNKDVDGVVIHALLHHLSTKELENFFTEFAKLSPGTKIFMYEPTFFKTQSDKPSIFDKVINKAIIILKKQAINFAKYIGKPDLELKTAIDKLYEDAEKFGWYISPKEVPFYENEIEDLVGTLCTLQNKYIVNKTDLDIAQSLTLNGIDKPGFLYSNILIPLASFLDRLSFAGKFTHYISPNQHLFVCYEWIKN